MNNRLKMIREKREMSQEEFGRRIGIESRAHISALESGKRNITDRIVNDVCREFRINENWLRYGNGEMEKIPKGGRLASYLGEISSGDDDFIQDLIEVYMELDPVSREALRKIRDKMIEKMKERERD